ncbi:hypothetical protein [Streptomyces sp. NPDC059009]|uniref:hypothetical protein n=1 Tax=Streptomyces sp. NPDC059009 TaxID=3346694 RepID=UPI003679FE1D
MADTRTRADTGTRACAGTDSGADPGAVTGTGIGAGTGTGIGTRISTRPLLVLSLTFALLSLVLVPLNLPLGWDETVYASRFGPYAHGPAVPFSAPRTRGVPLLIAPVASWSDSVVLLRVWLTLLSSAALYLGFRPWLRVLPGRTAVVAGALYGSLWFTLFYAGAAMPNHYTAMGATAATGLLLHDKGRPTPRTYAGIAVGTALATLMRPNDGAAVAAPLLLAAVCVPRCRGWGRALAVVGGFAAGAVPWAVEAVVRFGSVGARLREASDVQGGLRPGPSALHQLTALDGPLLCRPCEGDRLQAVALEWWIVLPVLVTLGLWTLHRAGTSTKLRTRTESRTCTKPSTPTRTKLRTRTKPSTPTLTKPGTGTSPRARAAAWLALAVGLCAAAPYLLLVPYGAPRFLLPAHALLSLPAALGVLAVARLLRARLRSAAATAVIAAAVAGHLGAQLPFTYTNTGIQSRARDDWPRVAAVLRDEGVRASCVLRGNTSVIPIAYATGCAAGPRGTRSGGTPPPDALVLRKAEPPGWARGWPRHSVPDTYAQGWTVALNPEPPHHP